MPVERAIVLAAFNDERRRQIKKWGPQTHRDGTGARYYQIQANAYKAINDSANDEQTNWLDILLEEVFEAAAEGDVEKLKVELVQSGAVIVAWLEDLTTRSGG